MTLDVTKCLQQIEMPDLLHVCAAHSEMSNHLMEKPWAKPIVPAAAKWAQQQNE